ncbi:MAG: penicillin-binding protein 2 [Actinomycetota bacterium]
MIGPKDFLSSTNSEPPGIDRTVLRLAVFGIIVVALFTALFSRLWFLQVLASEDFSLLADENKVRRVESEPPRGRILDRNGKVLVDNRQSLSVTLDREILEQPEQTKKVLKRLSRILDIPVQEFRDRLEDATVSPYKPIALANDISKKDLLVIGENRDRLPGVDTPTLPVRTYPHTSAAHVLGYVGEISPEQLESEYFTEGRPPYEAGDVVGKMGLERSYDRYLRGKPMVEEKIVNSAGKVVESNPIRDEEPGKDLITSLDLRIQKITESALKAGIMAARQLYEAPDGGVVVMDPRNGQIRAMATFPTYDPNILADGLSNKEYKMLGHESETGDDDAMLNRPIQAQVPPGSTFKTATAGAAMATGVADASTYLDCPPAVEFGNQIFRNWSSINYGSIGFAKSLEISCDTFYYELGWMMENRWGAGNGDGSEKFQDYLRLTGFGHPTGVDIPFEASGVVPDKEWLDEYCEVVESEGCAYGWLPGYSVNMSIGQGDLGVSPLQMAVSYAALLNGGNVLQPRFGVRLGKPDIEGVEETVREFKTKTTAQLPLDETEMEVLLQGLEDVISGPEGTARGAFAGFPLDKFPIAGKTGTAQIGSLDSGKNYAWFVSYAPVKDPKYVVAVYLHKAGHGGESAAPVARQIFEGIFKVDDQADVKLGADASR